MVAVMEALSFKGMHESGWCEKHQTTMLVFSGRSVCPHCQREIVEEQERQFIERATTRHIKRITFDRLEKDSIVSDYLLKEATFTSFQTDDEESEQNKLAARRLAGRYLKGEVFNTLLTGNAGTGKSHLAMSILRAVNDNADPWTSCLFLSLDEYLLTIRSTFGNKTTTEDEQSLIERVADVDLMVIDDLGAETGFIGTDKTASDFTQRILYSLMNKRQDKSTIITTNLNSAQITAMYDSKIISRLYRRLNGNIIKFESTTDKRMTF
jgi:DNA replication protein DnaC